jgi:hypothetical protein
MHMKMQMQMQMDISLDEAMNAEKICGGVLNGTAI